MTHKTAARSKPFGAGGIELNKIRDKLGAQLLCGVLLSLLAAILLFGALFFLSTEVLDHTVYGNSFMQRMTDQYFQKLQEYVHAAEVSQKNLHPLDVWCSRGDKVYLTVYVQGRILYASPLTSEVSPDDEAYLPELEDAAQEYVLTLSDGTSAQAFLYYYAGDVYYYLVAIVSGLAAFFLFSLCFVALVHRKLRYIEQLKTELDMAVTS